MTIQFKNTRTFRSSTVCLVVLAGSDAPAAGQGCPPSTQECCELCADPTSVSTLGQLDNFGTSLAIDGNTAVVGAPLNNDEGIDAGKAFVFAFNAGTNTWEQPVALVAGDAAGGDEFGHSVAVSEDIIVIGAWRKDDVPDLGAGAAYIFQLVQGEWGQVKKLTGDDAVPQDGDPFDLFGSSVAISGDTVVIGAYGNIHSALNRPGSAYVFKRDEGGLNNWGFLQRLDGSNPQELQQFGFSSSIDGQLIIVGAPMRPLGVESAVGAAFVFRFDTGSGLWQEEQVLTASDAEALDKFGTSVSISGDAALIGAPFNNDPGVSTGAAYVFRFQDPSWVQEAKFPACDAAAGDEFGFSVSLDGNLAVVCARENGFPQDDGTAHVFKRFSAGWVRTNKLVASDPPPVGTTLFGTSASLSGDKALIGDPFWNGGVGGEGAMYVFQDLLASEACNCPADLNGDGVVDFFDLSLLLASWAAGTTQGDIGGPGGCGVPDGVTDFFDLSCLLAAWAAGACLGTTGGGEGAQGGSGSSAPSLDAALTQMGFADLADFQAHISVVSDAEAFTCGCVLEVLLSAQP